MTGTRTRGCATCGTPITVTSRNPNRRYCTARCRVADWHRRTRAHPDDNATTDAAPNDVHAVPGDVHAPADDVPGANGVRQAGAGPGTSSLTHCPRCQTPITVLTWLLPPTAAHVTTPTGHG